MPKSVLQSNWYYHSLCEPRDDKQRRYVQTYLDFDAMGYDQVPTASTWGIPGGRNEYETIGWCRDNLLAERLAGFMTVPWVWTHPLYEYYLKNDAHLFFEARKALYPETLK